MFAATANAVPRRRPRDAALYAAAGRRPPGWLLRFANTVLSRNVELGPWIHVSSDVVLLGAVEDGQAVATRAVVVDELERSGHRFVTLDVATSAGRRRAAGHAHRDPHATPK